MRLAWCGGDGGCWVQITAALATLRVICPVINRREESLAEFMAHMPEQTVLVCPVCIKGQDAPKLRVWPILPSRASMVTRL